MDNTLMNASSFGIGNTPSALLRFPFRMTFDTSRFGEALPRGSIGLSLLFAFPFAMFWLRQQGSAGTENLRFYVRSELETIPLALKGNPVRELTAIGSNTALADRLQQLHFAYLLVSRQSLKDVPQWFPLLDRNFLSSSALLEFADEYVLVYRLRSHK